MWRAVGPEHNPKLRGFSPAHRGSTQTPPYPTGSPATCRRRPECTAFSTRPATPIYIGKSVNLKRRVRSYFYGGGPGDERKREMLRLARGLAVRRCGSDLEAQLEEADGIAALRPPFNRVLKNRSRGWYIEVDWSRPFPRLRVVRSRAGPAPSTSGLIAAGESRRRRSHWSRRSTGCGPAPVRSVPIPNGSPCLQHGIDQCSAPCVGLADVDAYRAQVRHAVAALLDGHEARPARPRPRAPPRRASRPRQAAPITTRPTSRPPCTGCGGGSAGSRSSSPIVRPCGQLPVDHSRLIVLPGAVSETWVLVPIARGRVLERIDVSTRAGRTGRSG